MVVSQIYHDYVFDASNYPGNLKCIDLLLTTSNSTQSSSFNFLCQRK